MQPSSILPPIALITKKHAIVYYAITNLLRCSSSVRPSFSIRPFTPAAWFRIAGSFGLVTSVQTLIPRLCLWCQPSLAMTSWRISGKCVKYIHGRQRKSSGSSDFCRIAADFPSCCRVTTGTTLVDYGGSNKYRKSLSYGYPDSGEVPKRQITPARCYRVLI